ncbi:hypothetical protein ABAC460_04425 [Asticcacaulis sp. AC460]|nr:hypothetical protein ABAC460_04425 [Asticcacaulis sp. AC460]
MTVPKVYKLLKRMQNPGLETFKMFYFAGASRVSFITLYDDD